jgi:GNAT superfamily N-acetyltransferase
LATEVVGVAGTGRFLPYDKERRWATVKDEQMIPDAIVQRGDLVLIPTISTRAVTVYVYSDPPSAALAEASDVVVRLAQEHGTADSRLVWFVPPPSRVYGTRAVRVQLRTFGLEEVALAPGNGVLPLHDRTAAEQASFAGFARSMAHGGFAFLQDHIQDGGVGPVLTCVQDGRVVGAIGPIETLPDSRGAGWGRALWQAAMRWGWESGAAYQLLQTQVGGVSDRLCRSEGLTDLGLVCTG